MVNVINNANAVWFEEAAPFGAGQWNRVVEPVQHVPQPRGYDLRDLVAKRLWDNPYKIPAYDKVLRRDDGVKYHDIAQFIFEEVGVGVQNLHLFGSRRFWGAVEGSDWDVAVEWSDELTRKLYDADWEGKEPYPDDNTKQVFEKKFKDTKVQLVLVTNIKTHRDIWNAMGTQFWNMFINKRSKSYLGEVGVREYFNSMWRVHGLARQYDLEELV